MNIDEKIKSVAAHKEDLEKQIKDVEKQSAMLQQRYQALTFTLARAEGALSMLQEIETGMRLESAAETTEKD